MFENLPNYGHRSNNIYKGFFLQYIKQQITVAHTSAHSDTQFHTVHSYNVFPITGLTRCGYEMYTDIFNQ